MTQEPVQSTVLLNYAASQLKPRRWARAMAYIATSLTGISLVIGIVMISWAYDETLRWKYVDGNWMFFLSAECLVVQTLFLLPLMLIGALCSRPKFARRVWLAMLAMQVLAITANLVALAILLVRA